MGITLPEDFDGESDSFTLCVTHPPNILMLTVHKCHLFEMLLDLNAVFSLADHLRDIIGKDVTATSKRIVRLEIKTEKLENRILVGVAEVYSCLQV